MPAASLVVRDPEILLAPPNEAPFAWSFASRMRALGDELRGETIVQTWLGSWKHRQLAFSEAGTAYDVPVSAEARPHVHQRLTCPWLKLDAANACDEACSACRAQRLHLETAPFDLLAIVNRMDLAADASPCSRDGGELRLVYTAVVPGTHRPLPMTVILEYAVTLPEGKDRRWLAQRWEEFANLPPGSAGTALSTWLPPLLAEANLLRVRSNEQIDPAGGPWELRQFVVARSADGQTRLLPTIVPETPPLSFTNSHELVSLLETSRSQILSGKNQLPASMVTATAVVPTPEFTWHVAGVDPVTLQAFNRNTCNGCHGALVGGGQSFQHIRPGDPDDTTIAPATLSAFFSNGDGRWAPELLLRGESLRNTLCGACTTPKVADAGAPDAPPAGAGAADSVCGAGLK